MRSAKAMMKIANATRASPGAETVAMVFAAGSAAGSVRTGIPVSRRAALSVLFGTLDPTLRTIAAAFMRRSGQRVRIAGDCPRPALFRASLFLRDEDSRLWRILSTCSAGSQVKPQPARREERRPDPESLILWLQNRLHVSR
jgi:hypothetical protein